MIDVLVMIKNFHVKKTVFTITQKLTSRNPLGIREKSWNGNGSLKSKVLDSLGQWSQEKTGTHVPSLSRLL